MPEQSILPILVASKTQNDAEHLNGLLRGLGMRVRSGWAGDAETLDKALEAHPELIFLVADAPPLSLDDLVRLRDLRAPETPVIAIGKHIDKLDITALMAKGARDLVAMDNAAHLKAVIERELPVARMAAQLQQYADALSDYETRLSELLSQSADAIAYVQDGIHMHANPAYLKLFGYQSNEEIEGIPVMDVFDPTSQAALKTAIQQVIKHGKTSEGLALKGVKEGEPFAVTVSLSPDTVEDEPCVRLAARVAHAEMSPELEQQLSEREREANALKASLADIRHRDPLTGVYHRAYFLEQLKTVKAGHKTVRALALVTADQLEAVEASVGAFSSDRIINRLVELINASVNKNEPVGRLDDDTFAIVLTRPALADVEKWAAALCKAVSKTIFETKGGSTSMTCSIGITEIDALAEPELLLSQAIEASETVAEDGGNRYLVYKPAAIAEDGGSEASWVKRITSALKGNTLKLAYQPIASLDNSEVELQDVLVRMDAGNGEMISAGRFMPYAERHHLVPAIDKWVVSHLLPVVASQRKSGRDVRFFARISTQFLTDPKMLEWLRETLKRAPSLPPGGLIFQLAESYLDKYLKETKLFIDALQKADCAIAISQFGMGRNSLGVLDHLKPDFIKLDDELTREIQTDNARRDKVLALVEKAHAKKIETIAQRVESADAIATLWQMGVQYIQGNYLQEPGATVGSADRGKLGAFG
ncbi:MAG TPA: EAL domain-containing protein [Gammaproteobacteria bacterium]|nr:EAL domain-containing protein [Gammaproteobacteria bacterium]